MKSEDSEVYFESLASAGSHWGLLYFATWPLTKIAAKGEGRKTRAYRLLQLKVRCAESAVGNGRRIIDPMNTMPPLLALIGSGAMKVAGAVFLGGLFALVPLLLFPRPPVAGSIEGPEMVEENDFELTSPLIQKLRLRVETDTTKLPPMPPILLDVLPVR